MGSFFGRFSSFDLSGTVAAGVGYGFVGLDTGFGLPFTALAAFGCCFKAVDALSSAIWVVVEVVTPAADEFGLFFATFSFGLPTGSSALRFLLGVILECSPAFVSPSLAASVLSREGRARAIGGIVVGSGGFVLPIELRTELRKREL